MSKREGYFSGSAVIRDVILGGQDGLVNVLGIVLAVAEATQSRYVILISGLAATFAESISMAAVAYTSAKAGKEYYQKKREELLHKNSLMAKSEVGKMLHSCGLRGTFLNKAILQMLSSKKSLRELWGREIGEFEHPARDALIVGIASLIGSVIPLLSFFILPVSTAIWTTLAVSTLVLFFTGAIKAEYTGAKPFRSGLEMAIVGMTAAIAGYLIGKVLGAVPL